MLTMGVDTFETFLTLLRCSNLPALFDLSMDLDILISTHNLPLESRALLTGH